jgi:selenocysteine lyase/cysteine desulfurase
MPIISFNVKGRDSSYVGEMLSLDDIAVRTGFHCAYPAHKAHSTASKGTVRISLSRHNNRGEAEGFLYKLKTLLNNV